MFGSMLGVGGGFIIVPIITLASGIPIQFAIGSSLVSIVINSCTATSVYISNHMTNLKLGLLLCTMLVPGAVAGALLGTLLPEPVLTLIFGLLLIYIAYTMLPKHPGPQSVEEMQMLNSASEQPQDAHAWLDDSYYDPALGYEVSYKVHHPVTGLVTSFFGGALSSMLGIGGGIINVPVMNKLMQMPDKAAVATSSIMLAFTTMTGSIIYASHGFIVPYLIAPLCIGVYIGARLGATLTNRVKGPVIMIIFSIFLMLTSISMLLKSFHIIGG